MRVFECVAYAMVSDVQGNKLDAKDENVCFGVIVKGPRPIG
jgi:hypothetical protein